MITVLPESRLQRVGWSYNERTEGRRQREGGRESGDTKPFQTAMAQISTVKHSRLTPPLRLAQPFYAEKKNKANTAAYEI